MGNLKLKLGLELDTLYSKGESQMTIALSSGDHSIPARSTVSTAKEPMISHVWQERRII